MKAEPRLAQIEVLRQSPLSATPVRPEEWAVLLELGGQGASNFNSPPPPREGGE